jgi:leader peptidase (prepilin peptidase) / N-methyltransferase
MEYFVVFLVGLAFGSFASVIIHRLHTQERGILWGRSKCPRCEKKLKTRDLVPLLSFIINKFKCRFCEKKISLHYPMLEITMGIFFALTYYLTITTFNLGIGDFGVVVFYLFTAFIFVLLSFYDMLFREVPDIVSLPAILISIISVLILKTHSLDSLMLGIATPVFFFGALFYLSRGRWLGGGDVRIGALMGAILGWPNIVTGLFLGYLLGAAYSLMGMTMGKLSRKSQIPFAPFLLLGTYITLFWGEAILRWYLNFG